MTREWSTPAQVAESMQVDEDTVRAWIADGTLRAVNVGHGSIRPRWRISADALEAFIAARCNRSAPPSRRRRREDIPQFV